MNVTEENFNQLYPRIKESLENAVFVAIDAEFSGLQSADKNGEGSSERLDIAWFCFYLGFENRRRLLQLYARNPQLIRLAAGTLQEIEDKYSTLHCHTVRFNRVQSR